MDSTQEESTKAAHHSFTDLAAVIEDALRESAAEEETQAPATKHPEHVPYTSMDKLKVINELLREDTDSAPRETLGLSEAAEEEEDAESPRKGPRRSPTPANFESANDEEEEEEQVAKPTAGGRDLEYDTQLFYEGFKASCPADTFKTLSPMLKVIFDKTVSPLLKTINQSMVDVCKTEYPGEDITIENVAYYIGVTSAISMFSGDAPPAEDTTPKPVQNETPSIFGVRTMSMLSVFFDTFCRRAKNTRGAAFFRSCMDITNGDTIASYFENEHLPGPGKSVFAILYYPYRLHVTHAKHKNENRAKTMDFVLSATDNGYTHAITWFIGDYIMLSCSYSCEGQFTEQELNDVKDLETALRTVHPQPDRSTKIREMKEMRERNM
jgi:hypothetical protein